MNHLSHSDQLEHELFGGCRLEWTGQIECGTSKSLMPEPATPDTPEAWTERISDIAS